MHPELLYDLFLSYTAPRYARKRCAVLQNVPFFCPAHLGKGTRWRVPVASPPAIIGATQASSLLRQPTICASRSRVRVMAPDTRQSEEIGRASCRERV